MTLENIQKTFLPPLLTREEKERWTYSKRENFTHALQQCENISALAERFPIVSAKAETVYPLVPNTVLYGEKTHVFDTGEHLLVEHITDEHAATSALLDQQHFTLSEGAKLTHIRIHTGGTLKRDVAVSIPKGATYTQFTLTLNSPLSRTETNVELIGEGAHVDATTICLLRENEHADTNIHTRFVAEGCTANIRNRNIAAGRSHAVFQGKFHVEQSAQKTDAYMLTENTLVPTEGNSFSARASHKPELEIYADDVKCSHGAATGTLDESQLFYLQARGVPAAKAKKMLLFAQIEELIDTLPVDYKEQISELAENWLTRTL